MGDKRSQLREGAGFERLSRKCLVYYGDGRKLEYDFVVRPGADPSRIRLAYEGADSLTTDQEGNLLIATGGGTLVQRKPLVYQEINGERREVQASYSVRAGKVEFALANWDCKRDLVIDPVLEYSTYLGGTGTDQAFSIAVDSSGAAGARQTNQIKSNCCGQNRRAMGSFRNACWILDILTLP